MLDGKQYVSLLAGAPTGSRLYTFVLDGKAPLPSIPKPAAPTTRATPQTGDAAGRALVARTCTSCHVLDVVTGTKLNRDSWKKMVDNMVERGAVATPEELSAIVDYLAKNFGAN